MHSPTWFLTSSAGTCRSNEMCTSPSPWTICAGMSLLAVWSVMNSRAPGTIVVSQALCCQHRCHVTVTQEPGMFSSADEGIPGLFAVSGRCCSNRKGLPTDRRWLQGHAGASVRKVAAAAVRSFFQSADHHTPFFHLSGLACVLPKRVKDWGEVLVDDLPSVGVPHPGRDGAGIVSIGADLQAAQQPRLRGRGKRKARWCKGEHPAITDKPLRGQVQGIGLRTPTVAATPPPRITPLGRRSPWIALVSADPR